MFSFFVFIIYCIFNIFITIKYTFLLVLFRKNVYNYDFSIKLKFCYL